MSAGAVQLQSKGPEQPEVWVGEGRLELSYTKSVLTQEPSDLSVLTSRWSVTRTPTSIQVSRKALHCMEDLPLGWCEQSFRSSTVGGFVTSWKQTWRYVAEADAFGVGKATEARIASAEMILHVQCSASLSTSWTVI